jgi:hypothetical protein
VEKHWDVKKKYNFENINYFLLNSEFAKFFDENLNKHLHSLYQTRKTSISMRWSTKVLTNYLTAMGNEFELSPETNFVDIYLPKE